jgi:hypothetical protein
VRKAVAVAAVVSLLAATLGAPSAWALTKSRAERAVVQRVKARYSPPKGAFADCHRLSSKRFGCTYSYTAASGSWCEGGATVRQFPDGVSVTLGKPHAVIDNGSC